MASEQKHTEGPWTITGVSQNTGNISIGSKSLRIVIAEVTNAASFGDFIAGAMKRGGGGFEQSDARTQFANADLIAAAPDMFDALQLVKELHSYTGEDAPGFAAMVDSRVEAAITRATGGQ